MLLRRFLILFFFVNYSAFAQTDHTHADSADKETRILILGDSLSAGYGLKQEQAWVQLLQNAYNKEQLPITLINASISGETSGGVLQRLPALLAEYTPEWVLVEIGGNDGLRGYPIKHLKQNLMQIVGKSKDSGAEVLLMEVEITPNLGKRYATMFTNTYQQVAKAHQINTIPFFIRSVATEANLMLPDGIHPNAIAQPQLAEIMKQHFDEALAEKAE